MSTDPQVGPVPGHVVPGAPELVWRLPDVEIRKASVSAQDNNCYVLTERFSGAQVLIDAADGAAAVLALLHRASPEGPLLAVVTTHRHWDHHRALAEVVHATGARALAGAEDATELPVPAGLLGHGDEVALGDVRLRVVALRGHTSGSIALAYTEPDGAGPVQLFSGDSLFPGGPGKTPSPTEFASLMADLEQRVFGVYGDDTIVHPGHGDSTTLGAERPHLLQWRERGW